MPLKSSHRMAVATIALSLVTLITATSSSAYLVNDTGAHMPLTSGTQAYGVFGPNNTLTFPQPGGTYEDSIFGTTVRRITGEFKQAANNDIYAKNGFWNADGTLMFHHAASGVNMIISTFDGAPKCSDVPGNFDGSFDPVDPNIWYWFSEGGTALNRFSVAGCTDGGGSIAVGGQLGGLGGSVDWIDSSGQYMVLNIGGLIKVLKKPAAGLPATIYGGPPVSATVGGGWIGISPDGNYVVTNADDGYHSYRLNHADASMGEGVRFWTLCGGHGDLVSASNGTTYLVTFDCHGFDLVNNLELGAAVYAVDVTKPATDSAEGISAQRRLPNKKLFGLESWNDADGHFSGVSRGPLRNWVFVSIESLDDDFGLAVDSSWWNRPYTQEIIMTNVVTGEIRRLAHHRSRGVDDNYRHQPRVSAGWGDCSTAKTAVAWASNFGQLQKNEQGRLLKRPYAGYSDIYGIDIVDPADTTPPDPSCLVE